MIAHILPHLGSAMRDDGDITSGEII